MRWCAFDLKIRKLLDPTPLAAADVLQSPKTLTEGRVVRELDGVTIEVESLGRTRVVRYLGVTLLDGGDVRAAFEFKAFLVEGKTVELSSDTVDVDLEGALLRCVFIDGEMVNLKFLNGGWEELAQSQTNFE